MTSWVYVFSKFTPEALLFEALFICLLIAGYSAYWVLYKRKLGSMENAVPTGVVKNYLNELIVDAERMRAQLFGLLAARDAGSFDPSQYQSGSMPSVNVDAALAAKLGQMEAKLAEQAAVVQSVLGEKSQLEKALAAAKAGGGTNVIAGADPALVAELQAKLKNLESKLAEYSVIEDDLANLKRLQQENAALKSALEGKGGAPAAVAAAAPAPTVTPAVAPAAPAPAAEMPAAGKVDQGAIDALFNKTDNNDAFEGLVDQVEKSLQGEAPAPAPAAAAPAPVAPAPAVAAAPAPAAAAPQPSTPAPAAATLEKSDADLVAEFEKMLNG